MQNVRNQIVNFCGVKSITDYVVVIDFVRFALAKNRKTQTNVEAKRSIAPAASRHYWRDRQRPFGGQVQTLEIQTQIQT